MESHRSVDEKIRGHLLSTLLLSVSIFALALVAALWTTDAAVAPTCTQKITVFAFTLKQQNTGPGTGSFVLGSDFEAAQNIQPTPPICVCSDGVVRKCTAAK